ncbi:MAG TPA: hypothetical protein VH593_25900, partial [Ktedonobacteraceae bacterium]
MRCIPSRRWRAAGSQRSPFYLIVVGLLLSLLTLLSACGGSPSSSNSKITITEMDYWSVPSQGATLAAL